MSGAFYAFSIFPCCFIGVEQYKSAPLEVKIFLEGKGTEMGGTMFRTGSLRKSNNPLEQSEPLVQKKIPVD